MALVRARSSLPSNGRCTAGRVVAARCQSRRDGAAEGEQCWVEVAVRGRLAAPTACGALTGATLGWSTSPAGRRSATGRSPRPAGKSPRSSGLRATCSAAPSTPARARCRRSTATTSIKRREQVELLLGIERLRRATSYAAAEAKEQKIVVDTLAARTPDLQARRDELEEAQNEAQRAHPAVQQATEKLDELKSERQQAKQQLEALRSQERLMLARRHEAQQADLLLAGERAAAERLAGQLAEAQAAESELATLVPLSAQVEELAARERELDLLRANHERAAAWRARHEQALQTTAELTDRIRALARQHELVEDSAPKGQLDPGGLEASIDRLHEQIEATEHELTQLRPERVAAGDAAGAAERRAAELELAVTQARRAGDIRAALAQHGDVEPAVDAAVAEWHEGQARRRQLHEAIEHDTQHREAVLAGTEQAACPTCKREFGEGELDQVLVIFERDLAAAHDELATIEAKLPALEAQGKTLRERARHAQALAAELDALGATGELSALEAEAPQRRGAAAGSRREPAPAARRANRSARLPVAGTA